MSRFWERGPQPEADPTIKYSIQFNWGMLRVSEEANDAYGLAPLVPGVIKGDSDMSYKEYPLINPRVDVNILGPNEIIDDSESSKDFPVEQMGLLSVHSEIEVKKDRSIVGVAFQKNREDLVDHTVEAANETLGTEDDAMIETAEGEMPLRDYIHHQAPQIVLHGLLNAINGSVEFGVAERILQNREKAILRHLTYIGGLGVAGSTGTLLLSTEAGNAIGSGDVLTSGALMVFTLGLIRRSMKSDMKDRLLITQAAQKRGATRANEVVQSIEEVYSKQHFDDRMLPLLENSDEDIPNN